ncbi:hypothetical protein TNCV_1946811 [Trichonephila clavipes]|nr:hypothetical protein TNCV_1946811 [Trichonephila clavipes]
MTMMSMAYVWPEFYSWNANGIKSKIFKFKLFVEKHCPDIFLIQETHLRPSQRLNISNYNCYRNDRITDGPAFGVLCEGNTRNRWRDGQVCPDVDKELWRLGPDGSGVFWRWTSVSRCGQGTMAPWARRLGKREKEQKEKDKRVRERERTEGGGETEKIERRRKETERESGRERVKPALNGEKG